MSTKSRQVIYGSRIRGAKIRAERPLKPSALPIAPKRKHGRSRWSYGGPAQPSPTIGQCLNGGYGWLEVECHRCKTRASLPLDAIRRPRNTPILKLEAGLKCRSCKKGRYAPPVHMIKLTQEREITPYVWVHPDDER
jgi:Fe-S-cluster-containing hydrogenase component 2